MKLGELGNIRGKLVREGDFSALGRPKDWQPNRLVSIENEADLEILNQDKNISFVITSETFAKLVPENIGMLIVDEPNTVFRKIHSALVAMGGFYPDDFDNEISSDAVIHRTAVISDRSVRIERNCRIGPKAFVGPQTVIEEDVSIGPGTILGADWSNPPLGDINVNLIRAGGIRIGKKAWIHANCVVERSIFSGLTEIGDYTYIDNLVSIGAGARTGKACLIVAAAVIGENASLGDEVWVGPNSLIADGVRIGRKGSVTLGSVVIEDIAAGKKVTGNFAIDHKKFIEFMRRIR